MSVFYSFSNRLPCQVVYDGVHTKTRYVDTMPYLSRCDVTSHNINATLLLRYVLIWDNVIVQLVTTYHILEKDQRP